MARKKKKSKGRKSGTAGGAPKRSVGKPIAPPQKRSTSRAASPPPTNALAPTSPAGSNFFSDRSDLFVLMAWVAILGSLSYALPTWLWQIMPNEALALGLIMVWRYAWQVTHAVRAYWFSRLVFPKLRAAADALTPQEGFPGGIYLVIPSYQESEEVTTRVFTGLFGELNRLPSFVEVCLVPSVASDDEEATIRRVAARILTNANVRISVLRQSEGKRQAMADALRHIRDTCPQRPDDLVVLMDGDSVMCPGALTRTAPFFRLNLRLGALTTNEDIEFDQLTPFQRQWFNLRFGKRNLYMLSHALSNKVLTLTGRLSIFRATVALDEGFISLLQDDHIDHWLHGRIKMLMGDDKSTFFHTLQTRLDMLYVPDVYVKTLESRKAPFINLTTALMFRWYGNMFRNNWRSIMLGPERMPFFIWLCLIDQRICMWTTLIGPLAAIMLGLFKSIYYPCFYVMHVIATRVAQLAILAVLGHRVRFWDLILHVYDQWVGSAMKIYVLFHLDSQFWSKGSASQTIGKSRVFAQHAVAHGLMVLCVAAYLYFTARMMALI